MGYATSSRVRFRRPRRPHAPHALPKVLLALPPAIAGQTLEACWRATSSATRGDKRDAVEVEAVRPQA